MCGWPAHRPTHALATYARTTGTRHAKEKPEPLVLPLPRRRGWPVHRPTHALATYARTTGTRHTREKPEPLVLPLLRRHAWLAGPPANTCSGNICPDNGNETHQRKTRTPRAAAPEHVKESPKPKPPRAVSPETARRRMTTPVVNTHTDTGAVPKENQPPSCRPLLRRHGAA